jgi:diguanylate cyclase (GGDEF)-like protein/PAS domain S-box-containing protein
MVIHGTDESPDAPEVRHRLSTTYLVTGLTAVALLAVVPPAVGLALFAVLVLASPLAVHLGARLWSRTEQRRPWRLVVLGEVLCIAGQVVRSATTPLGEPISPLAGPADALSLAGYATLILAVRAFGRARRTTTGGRDGAELVDSLIVSAGVGIPIWLFAMTSFATHGDLPTSARVLAVVYSSLTLLMLGGIARLALGGGARNRSYYLLLAGFVCLIGFDVLTTMSTLVPALTDVAVVVGAVMYVLAPAAALHPSMRAITEATATPSTTVGWHRLAALVGALLVAPATLVVAALTGYRADAATIVTGASLMSLLVVARMWMLVKSNERRARRERALRRAGETLVASTTRQQMLCGAIDAVVELGSELPGLEGYVVTTGRSGLTLVASTPDAGPLDLGPPLADDLEARRPTVRHQSVVLPLIGQNEVRGGLVVRAARPLAPALVDTFSSLASEISLALETAALVEDLHHQRSERRFRALIERSSDMIVILDADGLVTYVSPGCLRVLGFEAHDLLGRELQTVLHPNEAPALQRVLRGQVTRSGDDPIELRMADATGGYHVLEVTATDLLHDDDVAGIVLNARDTTERKRLADELRHQALHDTLTGLANRALLGDRVAHALTRRSDAPGLVAVLFIDLDDFKTVNDSLGHGAGDQLLVLVAERLRACLRTADTAARLGGDEFAILLDDPATEEQVGQVADRILEALHRPFLLEDREVIVSASLGIAIDPARAATADHLLRNADAAMYMAKQRGKGRWEMFDESMHDQAVARLELKASLAHAIEGDELYLNYQPIVELATGATVAVEALVRWTHPVRGLVPPAQFVPVAEETGLIVPMGRWILERACHDLASRPGWERLGLTVNVSVRQLQHAGFVADVLTALERSGLSQDRLTIEITESILMTNTDQIRDRLHRLRAHGVRIAIDDFGSGYSSLGYLQRFPVDVLKLDRSFVEDLQLDRPVGGVVRAIVELADGLDVRLVAEGIETAEQAEALRRRGCRYGQGFLYSRPVAADDLDRAVLQTTGVGLVGAA